MGKPATSDNEAVEGISFRSPAPSSPAFMWLKWYGDREKRQLFALRLFAFNDSQTTPTPTPPVILILASTHTGSRTTRRMRHVCAA